jgi:membrane protein implicated in regulation of membrane protease activity
MNGFSDLIASDPFWLWLVVGAVVLAVEVATGTGWLLWAAVAAGAVSILALTTAASFAVELAAFAGLTIVLALGARKLLPGSLTEEGPDINDNIARIVGRKGLAASAFTAGAGRVAIDGKEWAAELDGAAALASGAPVEVVSVEDYIQHNPLVANGREPFRAFFSRINPTPKPVAPIIADLVNIMADRDNVVLAFRRELPNPREPGKTYTTTWFDMFRIENGKLAEHWDYGTLPAAAPAAR